MFNLLRSQRYPTFSKLQFNGHQSILKILSVVTKWFFKLFPLQNLAIGTLESTF